MQVKSEKPMKNGGWLHLPQDDKPVYLPPVRPAAPKVEIDAEAMWRKWLPETKQDRLLALGKSLGVETMALIFLGFVWAPERDCWVIPMRDANAKIIGLRTRHENGEKKAVTGSKAGLFYTTKLPIQERLWIVEGPTDTAAAITLEMTALGRPSCLGCEEMIYEYIQKHHFRQVVIVADNDKPGIQGAERLLGGMKVPSLILIPPCKDIREYVSKGGSREGFNAMVKDMMWRIP